MVLPKLSLRARAESRTSRGKGLGMHRQWQMFKLQPNLLRKSLQDSAYRALSLFTERTLKVRKLSDRYLCLVQPSGRCPITNIQSWQSRLLQKHVHFRCYFQFCQGLAIKLHARLCLEIES